MVQLKSCDGTIHEAVIYVHSVHYPQDPPDEASNGAVLGLSRYIKWILVHPDAPDDGLFLLFTGDELRIGIRWDSETFSARAIVKVHEYVQVTHKLESATTGATRRFICNWALQHTRVCKPGTIESFVAVPEDLGTRKLGLKKFTPHRIDSLNFGDLFCGVGGAFCGFKDAGFTSQFGAEASDAAGEAFRNNCLTAILYPSIPS